MQIVESRHVGLDSPFLKKDCREMSLWFIKLTIRENDL